MASSRTSTPKLAAQPQKAGPVGYALRLGDREFLISSPEMVIGRGADSHVTIDESQVSRRHARVFIDGGEPYIEDLDSANGTFVNHARLHGRARLFSGDLIFIGTQELELVDDGSVDRPTMPVLEPASAIRSGKSGTDVPPPSSRPVPKRRPSSSLRETSPGTIDVAALEIEHAGRLADKMFAMGRTDAALKILADPLEAAIISARFGQIPSGAVVDVAGRYAVRLAGETLDGKWVDLAIELHNLLARPLREETMQQLAALRARAPIGTNDLIEKYVTTLRENAALMGGAERILCERLTCLLPVVEPER